MKSKRECWHQPKEIQCAGKVAVFWRVFHRLRTCGLLAANTKIKKIMSLAKNSSDTYADRFSNKH